MCFLSQRRAIFRDQNSKKVLPDPHFFNILTSECAFRHSGVQFLRIRTSKSAPTMRCFVHVHFQMCFSPQQRAIFRQQNFKKCFGADVFCAFLLEMCFSPQRRAFFSTSELQKVLRDRQFFNIFTSKVAFRHSGVQFLMSPLSTYLRTRRFNRPTFRLTRHTKKHSISRLL